MKLVIAGGRDYNLTEGDYEALDVLLPEVTEVVSGCARGADTSGEEWAKSRGIPIKKFPADWSRYGKGAGNRRNQEMAKYADAVVLFPGGSGTECMYQEARIFGITKIYDMR